MIVFTFAQLIVKLLTMHCQSHLNLNICLFVYLLVSIDFCLV